MSSMQDPYWEMGRVSSCGMRALGAAKGQALLFYFTFFLGVLFWDTTIFCESGTWGQEASKSNKGGLPRLQGPVITGQKVQSLQVE